VGSHLSATDSCAEAHLSDPLLHLAPCATPRSTSHGSAHHACARAIKAVPRSGQAGPDAIIALSDTASRLASCTSPTAPVRPSPASPPFRSTGPKPPLASTVRTPPSPCRYPGKPLCHRVSMLSRLPLTRSPPPPPVAAALPLVATGPSSPLTSPLSPPRRSSSEYVAAS
jgi:hypothetical protein